MLPNERNHQILRIMQLLDNKTPSGLQAERVEDQSTLQFASDLLESAPFAPDRQQEIRLQKRLQEIAARANPQSARKQHRRQQGLNFIRNLAVAATLIGVTVLVVILFGQKATAPAPLPAVSVSIETVQPTPSESVPAEIIPSKLAVVPDACGLRTPDTFLDKNIFTDTIPQVFVGGGNVESGNFRFDLWLSCDTRFSSDLSSGADDFSEVNGLGILSGWQYNGPKEEGTLWDYVGIEPFVMQSGGTAPVAASTGSFVDRGIHIGHDIIPDFSRQDTRLRYIYFTQLPNGKRTGAALSFTLQRELEGYRPINIEVSVLEPEELAGIENQKDAPLPFATRNPIDEFPLMADIRQKLQDWESSLLDQPGWLYIKTAVTDTGTNMFYNGVSEYIEEGWYKLDEYRQTVQSINQMTALDGRVLQQSIYKDGVGQNLTTSSSYNYPPAPMRLINDILWKLTSQARTGEDWQPTETNWLGQTAWVFWGRDSFPSPTTVDRTDGVIAVEGRDYVDPLSGRRLGNETYLYTADGQEKLARQNVTLTMEHIDQPPAEVMALFDQEPTVYSPPEALGTMPPAGFDASQAKLSLTSHPGDNFDRPTFWVGDIFADDYLLGRLNFGMAPGGLCQRSSDGSRIAILYDTESSQGGYNSEVQWFNLNNLDVVNQPALQLNVNGRFIAWSPTDSVFAVSGCLQDESQCGVYLVDTNTNTVRLLSPVALSAWPIIWNPDGSQLAVVDTRDDQHRFYVIDTTSGETDYEGLFDADNWQVPADSSAANWGVRIPHGSSEEDGCFN